MQLSSVSIGLKNKNDDGTTLELFFSNLMHPCLSKFSKMCMATANFLVLVGMALSLWCFQTCFIIETISTCCIDRSKLQANEDLWIWTWNSNGVCCSSYYRVSKGNCHPCLACHTKIVPHGFLSLPWIDRVWN